MSGAWTKGANRAVATPPASSSLQQAAGGRSSGGSGSSSGRQARGGGGGRNTTAGGGRHGGRGRDNNEGRGEGGRGGGRGGGGRGGGGRGGGGGGRGGRDNAGTSSNNHHHHNKNNNNNNNQGGGGGGKHVRVIIKDVQLLENGAGDTPEQQAVHRISARVFMSLRLKFLEPPGDNLFQPHTLCHWTSESRLAELLALSSKAIELGDVSKKTPENNKNKNDTAPALEDCKPLEVNEATRWKPKVMQEGGEETKQEEFSTEEVVSKALLILNKVSWTTLEKLTAKFMEDTNLANNEDIRKACIAMLVHKANTEPHFGPMYAQLCTIIAKQVKPFKKELLTQCQKEFEIDTAHKIAKAIEGVTDPEEQKYHATLIRKAYIGHMQFLGELYKRDVVKLAIMMYCLEELLKEEDDEENLECFAQLMTTMGHKLDDHAKQNKNPFDWSKVEYLRTSNKISNRIKFLLQDLMELKDRGWIKRRKEETAKTIDQLHKEVAKEEHEAAMASKGGRRVSSSQNLRRSTSLAAVPSMDDEGFVQISRTSIKKVQSINAMDKPPSSPLPAKPSKTLLRRSQSQPASMSNSDPTASPAGKRVSISNIDGPSLPSISSSEPSPDECTKKAKALFKEYFVGGDTDDAVLTIDEMVGVGKEGSVERGAKVVEAGCLTVMEMKETEVQKLLTVMLRCVQENKIDKDAIVKGLNDPLEYLSDIEIDAPLAGDHLAAIVAEYMKLDCLTLDFLKDGPEYFRTDGKPAVFAVKILKKRGGDASEEEVKVVEELMTDDDKKNFPSGKDMITA